MLHKFFDFMKKMHDSRVIKHNDMHHLHVRVNQEAILIFVEKENGEIIEDISSEFHFDNPFSNRPPCSIRQYLSALRVDPRNIITVQISPICAVVIEMHASNMKIEISGSELTLGTFSFICRDGETPFSMCSALNEKLFAMNSVYDIFIGTIHSRDVEVAQYRSFGFVEPVQASDSSTNTTDKPISIADRAAMFEAGMPIEPVCQPESKAAPRNAAEDLARMMNALIDDEPEIAVTGPSVATKTDILKEVIFSTDGDSKYAFEQELNKRNNDPYIVMDSMAAVEDSVAAVDSVHVPGTMILPIDPPSVLTFTEEEK